MNATGVGRSLAPPSTAHMPMAILDDIADMALLRTCGTDRGGFFAGRAGGLSGGASGCSNPAFLSRTAELI